MLKLTPFLNLFSEKLDKLQQKACQPQLLPSKQGGRVFPRSQGQSTRWADGEQLHSWMDTSAWAQDHNSSLRPRKEDPGTPPASLSRAQMEGCALTNQTLRLCLDMMAVVSVPQTHHSLIC